LDGQRSVHDLVVVDREPDTNKGSTAAQLRQGASSGIRQLTRQNDQFRAPLLAAP
jgi:hypothetical protein